MGSTIAQRRRSGIHRVALETERALADLAQADRFGAGGADFDLVRYDALEGRLRFVDAVELDGLFGPGRVARRAYGVRADARRVGRPFREALDLPQDSRPQETWLLVPEVVWHENATAPRCSAASSPAAATSASAPPASSTT